MRIEWWLEVNCVISDDMLIVQCNSDYTFITKNVIIAMYTLKATAKICYSLKSCACNLPPLYFLLSVEVFYDAIVASILVCKTFYAYHTYT